MDTKTKTAKTTAFLASGLLLAAASSLAAHDMFLKLGTYFLQPNSEASVALLNGTFRSSENVISRDRMEDVSLAGPGPAWITHPRPTQWRDTASTAVLDFETRGPGTYVLGVSTKPRTFRLTAEEFDAYLEHDGVLDVLERRRRTGRAGTPAVETYSKHVKAVLQVGDLRTDGYLRRFGYPVELVPRRNPYRLSVGDTLPLLLLKDGEPLAGQLVYASYQSYEETGGDASADEAGNVTDQAHSGDAGGETPAGPGEGSGTAEGDSTAAPERSAEAVETRTDQNGIARIPLTHEGRWYARLIHMVSRLEQQSKGKGKKSAERALGAVADSVDYVSEWTTLTWQVRAESPPEDGGR